MNRKVYKNGNSSILFLSLGIWLIILVLFITSITYAQINVVIYNIKSDLFYIVQNSLSRQSLDNLAYSKYSFDEVEIKAHIENILTMNYIKESENKKKNNSIKEITVTELEVLNPGENNICNVFEDKVRIHIKIKVKYIPVVQLLGSEKEIYLHDDVKMTLLDIE